ncbi:MAG: aldo/keto reductase [Bacteroidales bacterium]|jgi:L-glyceraldehyde 3-phosphate reductase|nr:aldo/keto reductase [Bacteroidales bacterium]
MTYKANDNRYDVMKYSFCGASGLELPQLSLGLWHNFGGVDVFENAKSIILNAFDAGITHFDIANNYGPPAGSAEETFAKILHSNLQQYRDELIISTKAGYGMWNGPYGDGGSKKYLVSSCNQSLKRLKLDYVDIFYHHRFDPNTPLEETADALELIYRQGKALYIGISNYSKEQTNDMLAILRRRSIPCLIHQMRYSMFAREPESSGLMDMLAQEKIGSIAYSPLAQGLLSNRYLNGIPDKSRITLENSFLQESELRNKLPKIQQLHALAQERGQSLSELAIAWLWHKGVTSVLIGASSVAQLQTNLKALNSPQITAEEMGRIDTILKN